MTIDTNTMISITEANQNFSKVARVVDEHGTAVILKNNVPRYLVIDFSKADREKMASTEDVLAISNKTWRHTRCLLNDKIKQRTGHFTSSEIDRNDRRKHRHS